MGINFAKDFAGVPMGSTAGIGGASGHWEEMAELQFLHQGMADWDTITLPIHIASPTRANSRFPSLLGRDVLQWYKFTADAPAGTILLERSAP